MCTSLIQLIFTCLEIHQLILKWTKALTWSFLILISKKFVPALESASVRVPAELNGRNPNMCGV